MKSVCLAVLNYNGKHHLEFLLPSLEAACAQSPCPAVPLVLDNLSPQDDATWVKNRFPGVQCISAPSNDFLFSYNWLLKQLPHDIVVLLNNDLRVSPDFLAPLLRHLESDDVFAASSRSFDWEGTHITSGPARLTYQNGFYDWAFDTTRQETSHTLFCSGGFMAVDRLKFLELEGFNRLFHPAYCEDLDLCFRAWRRGWRCIYEPASTVWHREQGSWSESTAAKPNLLNLRNSLLFQWSSLPMEKDKTKRYKSLAKLFLHGIYKKDSYWLKVYVQAAKSWSLVSDQYSWMKASPKELDLLSQHFEMIPTA